MRFWGGFRGVEALKLWLWSVWRALRDLVKSRSGDNGWVWVMRCYVER